jgi:hypothetical protein
MLNESKKTGVSRCLYCQSTSYGKGCRYGPKGVHFHSDNPLKCAYCGSTSYGPGCKFNPISKIHIHGIDYNIMFKESVQKDFLINALYKEFKDFESYKLGIIDEDGNKIKEPITEEEKAAYSPAVRTILKVKKYLGSKIDLMKHTMVLENTQKLNYNKENHKEILLYEEKINDIFRQLHEATNSALENGLTLEQIESILQ